MSNQPGNSANYPNPKGESVFINGGGVSIGESLIRHFYVQGRTLAREFGADSIRVGCMMAGWVMTEHQIRHWLMQAGKRQIEERQCLPDRLQPSDIARMALFLAADDSAMCTSQQFNLDGGWI